MMRETQGEKPPRPSGDRAGEPALGPDRMQEAFEALATALPELDFARVEALVGGMRLFPASGRRIVLKKFVSGTPAEQALAHLVLAEYGERAVDDLNALVFDVAQPDEVKVRADELLAELGKPIDPDVFAMSVKEPEALRSRSPWQAERDLAQDDVEGAAGRLAALDPGTRAVVLHHVVRRKVPGASALLRRVQDLDEPSALAVVSAASQAPDGDAVEVLVHLAEADYRTVQKAARRALHSLRTSGVDVPEAPAPAPAEAVPPTGPPPAEEAACPLHRAAVVFSRDRSLAVVNVAREYPNGRLQVLTAVVDFWKRGIRGARYWLDMSKSRFRRLLAERTPSGLALEDVDADQARRLVARGVRVAREVGSPIPFDLQAGKHLLPGVMEEAEAIEHPYVCSRCGTALPPETVAKIKDAAAYEQVPVETRCESCRSNAIG